MGVLGCDRVRRPIRERHVGEIQDEFGIWGTNYFEGTA